MVYDLFFKLDDVSNGIPENSCSPPSGGVLSHQSSFGSGGSGSTPIQEVGTFYFNSKISKFFRR